MNNNIVPEGCLLTILGEKLGHRIPQMGCSWMQWALYTLTSTPFWAGEPRLEGRAEPVPPILALR